MADYAIHDTTLIGTSNVIRKKEGSSALIDPADYPKRINLMGMLEEKTQASASVCSFSDGADDVPMSSVVAHIDATQDGIDEINMVQTGKNIYDKNAGVYDDTYFNQDGTTSHYGDVAVSWIRVKPNTQYTFSLGATPSRSTFLRWINCDKDKNFISRPVSMYGSQNFPYTVTTPNDCQWVQLAINEYPAVQVSSNDWIIQIEENSSETAYEDYNATQYTASLGRTIYGGQVDIVNGTAKPTNYLDTAEAETKSNNSVNVTCDGNGKYTATGTATGGSANITFMLKTPCEIKSGMYLHLMNSPANASVSLTIQKQDNTSIYSPTLSPANRIVDLSSYVGETIYSIRLYVVNNASSDVTFSPMLCYSSAVTPYSPYFAPFTFDGQEIPSLLGVNNLWHDAGETEAVYRSSGTVTPVLPDLGTKTITENGTYDAEDDGLDGYSSVTVNVSSVPSGNHDDPYNAYGSPAFGISMVYSCYFIDDGVLKPEIVMEMKSITGYEGICLNLSEFGLESGKTYTVTLTLDLPSITFSTGYPFGIKYSETRVPSSGNPSTSTYNIQPTESFAYQTGKQTISMQFEAHSTNYLLILLSCAQNNQTALLKIKDISFEEVTV